MVRGRGSRGARPEKERKTNLGFEGDFLNSEAEGDGNFAAIGNRNEEEKEGMEGKAALSDSILQLFPLLLDTIAFAHKAIYTLLCVPVVCCSADKRENQN